MRLVDSHCHLDDQQFDTDRDAVIKRALEAGVTSMLAIGTGIGPPDLEAGIRLAERYEFIHASVGVHPHDAAKADGRVLQQAAELLRHPEVVAAGEIGLDYHYDFSPREQQRSVFVEQLKIAADAALPVIIHTREAWDDTLAVLEKYWPAPHAGGIMHCFSGGPAEAQEVLRMGFHVSFAGIVTFPKAKEVQEAVQVVPPDRLLVETDCPYLAPAPKRGKRNEPAYVVHAARKVAELRGETLDDIARTTTDNYERLCLRRGIASK